MPSHARSAFRIASFFGSAMQCQASYEGCFRARQAQMTSARQHAVTDCLLDCAVWLSCRCSIEQSPEKPIWSSVPDWYLMTAGPDSLLGFEGR